MKPLQGPVKVEICREETEKNNNQEEQMRIALSANGTENLERQQDRNNNQECQGEGT